MFNEKIKEYRKKLNLTQEQLAEKINESRQTIVKWESGESEPTISIAKSIAEVFGVTIEEMIGTTPKSKELSIARKVWTIVAIIIVLSFMAMILVIMDPYVEEFFDNMSDNAINAMAIFIIVSIATLAIAMEYLKRYSIKHQDKQIYQSLMPKDIFGRNLNMYDKKIRFLYYFFDVFGFLVFISAIDILSGNAQLKDSILVLVVVGIPAYIVETILNENKIKKFNKMK